MKWAEEQCPKVVISFLLVSSLHSAPYKVPYSEYGIVSEWVISGTALATPSDPAQLFKLCASLLSFVLLLLSCNKDERWQRGRDETCWREETDGGKKKRENSHWSAQWQWCCSPQTQRCRLPHCEWSLGAQCADIVQYFSSNSMETEVSLANAKCVFLSALFKLASRYCNCINVCRRKKLREMMSAVACGLAVAHAMVIMTEDIIPVSLHRHQSYQKLLKEHLSAHTLCHQLFNCKSLFDHFHAFLLAEMRFPPSPELTSTCFVPGDENTHSWSVEWRFSSSRMDLL